MSSNANNTKKTSFCPKESYYGSEEGTQRRKPVLLEHRKNMGDVMQKSEVLQGTKYL